MWYSNRHPESGAGRGVTAALGMLLAVQACLGPVRSRAPVDEYVQGAKPSRIMVTLSDGTEHELRGPEIVLDTLLMGWTDGGTRFVGFPLASVRQVASREPSATRTAALLGGVAAGAVAAIALLAGASEGRYVPGNTAEGGGDDN